MTRRAVLSFLVAAALVTACSTGDISGPRGIVATISAVSGHAQIGHAGEQLPDAIVVRVTRGDGVPVAGVALTFVVREGEGTVHEASAATDGEGYASALWTIGNGLFHTLIVSLTDDRFVAMPATISATTDRWVHLSIVSGDRQTGIQGEQLPAPLVFRLTDGNGDPVPVVDVRFDITAGGGHLSAMVVPTNDEGLVEVRSTLGTGAYQRIRASIRHEYWFAKYAFAYADAQFVASTSEARWISGMAFRTPDVGTIPHDGRILESEHFLVFSDASSDAVRQQYADMAEESLVELLEAFDISSAEELGVYTDRPDTKLTIYCSAARDVYMHAFTYGFVLFDINHSVWEVPWAPMRRMNYRNIVKHELMHVVQLLFGSGVTGPWGESWFSEGIAEYLSGGSFYTVESLSQVRDWRRDENHVNPVTIRVLGDIPTGEDPARYYPMFGLAVEYLLDAKGRGRTLLDVRNMLTDMGQGSSFSSAFQAHMGISVDAYQAQLYNLIAGFLAIY